MCYKYDCHKNKRCRFFSFLKNINDFTTNVEFSLNAHRPIICVTNMTVTKTRAVDRLVSCVAIAHLCHITNKSVNYVQICVSP